MSLLTPLYIAGLLAVSLPLLFHLIRRTPRGRMPFSSLMFLAPSPPRLTRKSRLDDLLLLLLRGLALAILALAFARPFLRSATNLDLDGTGGRRVAILVDREKQAGSHEAAWNGRDDNGRQVGSGLYFYRIVTGELTMTRKLILLR